MSYKKAMGSTNTDLSGALRMAYGCGMLAIENANLELENVKLAEAVSNLEKSSEDKSQETRDELVDRILEERSRLHLLSWQYRDRLTELEDTHDRAVRRNEQLLREKEELESKLNSFAGEEQ